LSKVETKLLTALTNPEVASSGVKNSTHVTGGWFCSPSRRATIGSGFGSSMKLDDIPVFDNRRNNPCTVIRCLAAENKAVVVV
jgi:hypothetical protein